MFMLVLGPLLIEQEATNALQLRTHCRTRSRAVKGTAAPSRSRRGPTAGLPDCHMLAPIHIVLTTGTVQNIRTTQW